tara:strand:- start:76634 stop:77224 length:591 start_codon:yes stop_codon:yes gene_type:complete
MRLSAFETFQMFHALRLHFTSSYDYVKYHGKTNVGKEAFSKRKDRYQFQRLCRKHDADEMFDFILANLMHGQIKWVGELLDDGADDVYTDFKRRKESQSYVFDNEIGEVLNQVEDVKELFTTAEFPIILTCHMQRLISTESMIILNEFIPFFGKFDKVLSKDFLWPRIRDICMNARPFITFDREKIKKILLKRMKG